MSKNISIRLSRARKMSIMRFAMMPLELTTYTAEQTRAFGARLGRLARAGDLFCLEGDLGAGKTCFTQGLGQGLGITDAIHSPTFIIANEHRGGRMPLFHLDVYRVNSAAEAWGIGLDDYLNDEGVCVIEWAEKIRAALPRESLWITFRHRDETTRAITFNATGARYEQLVRELASEHDASRD